MGVGKERHPLHQFTYINLQIDSWASRHVVIKKKDLEDEIKRIHGSKVQWMTWGDKMTVKGAYFSGKANAYSAILEGDFDKHLLGQDSSSKPKAKVSGRDRTGLASSDLTHVSSNATAVPEKKYKSCRAPFGVYCSKYGVIHKGVKKK
ncbi:MAG: hypothetical protein ACTSRU_21725 [Candidatus Hodarchaeales archaeon]